MVCDIHTYIVDLVCFNRKWFGLFWTFLTKTKQDKALTSHVDGKIWPNGAQFWLGFLTFLVSSRDDGHQGGVPGLRGQGDACRLLNPSR